MPIITFTTLFAVVGDPGNAPLEAAIIGHFPTDHISFGAGRWFVVTTGTAKDLSDKLGITDGASGAAVVLAVSGYYGRTSSQIWEWIAAKNGKPINA